MTRSGLVASVNGLWNRLPVICGCGHEFMLKLGDDVWILAARDLNHKWFMECPRCHKDCPVIWPNGTLRTYQNPVHKLIVCDTRPPNRL